MEFLPGGVQITQIPFNGGQLVIHWFSPERCDMIPFKALGTIFKECFNGHPWFEYWTDRSAIAALHKATAGDFDLFTGSYHSKDGRPDIVGFSYGMPLESYAGCELLVGAGAPRNSFYLADLATLERCRRSGIGTELRLRLIQRARARGFRAISARTRPDNTDMIRINDRWGFKEVGRCNATTGDVESERIVFVQY